MGRGTLKAVEEIAMTLTQKKALSKADRERRKRKAAPALTTPADPRALVNPFAAQHGSYEVGTVVDLSGELGGKRMSILKVMLNRGGTAVDRWIANDQNELFGESQQRAIQYTQNLWLRASGGVKAVDPTRDVVDAPLGWSQQEALGELKKIEARVPEPFWNCYENVCRFDEEAGVAGSRLANNSRSAIDAAKTTVAFTASLIAQWRRL